MIDDSVFNGGKVLYHTFGCKLNFAETSTIGNQLADKGFRSVAPGERPDIIIVNTCSVTEVADRKCRQLLHRYARKYPEALIVVTGCYAQLKPDEVLAIDGVDIVLGSEQKLDIVKHIERWQQVKTATRDVSAFKDIRKFSHSCSRGDRTRYFLKVQDGCDYFCSYCTIPFARGRSRCDTIASLVDDACRAADEGGKEIIITGVNIGDFGKNTGERFIDLLTALDDVKGIERYRISSIEPDLLTDEMIDFVATSRSFMPHFHIPLQSGSDDVLRVMRRHYDTALFADKVARINTRMPDAFIGVDLIAGMRGETEEFFRQSYDFCASLDISRLHVFPYSERPGTLALRIEPKVSAAEKASRVKAMLELSDAKLRTFVNRFVGSVRPVLFEQPKKGMPMHGFTDNYLKVELPYVESRINTIGNVTLGSPDEEMTLAAELVE